MIFREYQLLLKIFKTLNKNTVQPRQKWNTLKNCPLSVDSLAALETINHMQSYHAILLQEMQQESLPQLAKLKSTSYYLKLHITTHGIKPEHSKILLDVFLRNHQKTHRFNEAWRIFNSSLGLDASQSIRKSINTTCSHILQNHRMILEAI